MVRDTGSRRVEPGDCVFFDGDAWDVIEVVLEDSEDGEHEHGRAELMRKDSAELPVVVGVPVANVEITSPGGSFVGGVGGVHGSVSGSLDGDDGGEGDEDDEADAQDAQDVEPTQATLSGFGGGC